MRTLRHLSRHAFVLIAVGILTGAATRVEGAEAPEQCPPNISPSGWIIGEWFYNVPMTMQHNPGGGTMGYFTADPPDPVSIPDANGIAWGWQNGAGTFSCWAVNLVVIVLHVQSLIPPAEGSLYPATSSDGDCGAGGGGGSGGSGEPLASLQLGADSGLKRFSGRLLADCSGSGSGSGGAGGGGGCWSDYGEIDVSYDGGVTWESIYEGWYTECPDGSITIAMD